MDRRSFLTGLTALIATPAIVRASSLMPLRGVVVATEVPLVVYGNSPGMVALPDLQALRDMHSFWAKGIRELRYTIQDARGVVIESGSASYFDGRNTRLIRARPGLVSDNRSSRTPGFDPTTRP